MKNPLLPRSLALLCCLFLAVARLAAADNAVIAELQAADDERVAAILAPEKARLDAILSDDLYYTHSNGKHDTKASYSEALLSHKTVYKSLKYVDRGFVLASPDVALMHAHVLLDATSASGSVLNDLSILAVWRKEHGRWRFLAWQSAKLPAPAPKS